MTRRGRRGFTLIELMVVMAVLVLLICLAMPQLAKAITRSKESVLANNLYTLRTMIGNYTYEKGKAPHNLEDLVSAGYLHEIPTDPMNNDSTDWRIDMEDALHSADQSDPGIRDVHSSSDKTGLNGKRYSEW